MLLACWALELTSRAIGSLVSWDKLQVSHPIAYKSYFPLSLQLACGGQGGAIGMCYFVPAGPSLRVLR